MMGHEGIAHPGVTPEKEGSSRNYQFYYMWISCLLCLQVLHDFFKINMNILLLFQALFFYLPHFMWSIMEMDLIKSFSYQMKDPESDDVNRMKRTERCQKSKIVLI